MDIQPSSDRRRLIALGRARPGVGRVRLGRPRFWKGLGGAAAEAGHTRTTRRGMEPQRDSGWSTDRSESDRCLCSCRGRSSTAKWKGTWWGTPHSGWRAMWCQRTGSCSTACGTVETPGCKSMTCPCTWWPSEPCPSDPCPCSSTPSLAKETMRHWSHFSQSLKLSA